MQNLLTVDNHSFREDLLTGGPVLDAGARGFVFAKWFAERGHTVLALDPSPDCTHAPVGITLMQRALVSRKCPLIMRLEMGEDPNAWYVQAEKGNNSVMVETMTLGDFQYIKKWDLIKLNIEGSEYDILDEIDGPIARQIVFSFHEHTGRARGREECDRIIAKLSKWYDVHNQVWEQRYGCRENYWDVLLTEKGA